MLNKKLTYIGNENIQTYQVKDVILIYYLILVVHLQELCCC